VRKRHSASHLIGFQAVTSNKRVFVNREREREGGVRKRHSASHLIGFQAVTSNKKVSVNRERERERERGEKET
jgi:hypothetical protein